MIGESGVQGERCERKRKGGLSVDVCERQGMRGDVCEWTYTKIIRKCVEMC